MIRKPVLPIAHWPLRWPVTQKSLLVHTYTQTDPITEHSSLQAWWIWIYCIQYDFKHWTPADLYVHVPEQIPKVSLCGCILGSLLKNNFIMITYVKRTFITWASNKSTQFSPRFQSFSVNLLPCYFSLFRCCT